MENGKVKGHIPAFDSVVATITVVARDGGNTQALKKLLRDAAALSLQHHINVMRF